MNSPGPSLSGGTLRMNYAPEASTGASGFPLKAPANLINQGTMVWADGFGGARLQDADGLDLRATHLYSGGAIGLDRQVQPNLRLGAFFGGGFGKLGVDQNSQTVNTDYVTGGLYGRYTIEAQFFDVTLFGGATRNSSNRQVFDNLASNGVSNSTASYNGRFIAPEIAYGWNILDRNGVTWTPAARVRYIAGWFDGFSEAGSAQSLIVNSRTVQDLEARLEMALSTTQPFGPGLISTQIKGGIVGLTRLGNTNIDTILIGQNLSFAAPGRDNAVGLLTGFGVDYRFAPNANAFVNFEGIAMTDSGLVGSARGGVEIKF